MNIARILYPVEVLGPGKRIGLWLCGCDRACKGCSNPELWHRKPELELTVADIMSLIERISATYPIDGFTITGGEPMDQACELAALVQQLRKISSDVLVYSGYKIEELRSMHNASIDDVLNSIAVLIDSPYIEELNDNSLLRGSSNQRIHILDAQFSSSYKDYLSKGGNRIQNFTTTDGVVSVGIHQASFSGRSS